MPTKGDELIAQILVDALPVEIADAYRMMTQIKYPLSDRHALLEQVNELEAKGGGKASLQVIRSMIGPLDFPIQSPIGGVEKLHARLGSLLLPPIGLEPSGEPEPPEIDYFQEYVDMFGVICGQRAFQLFSHSIENHVPELRAFILGLREGRKCSRRFPRR